MKNQKNKTTAKTKGTIAKTKQKTKEIHKDKKKKKETNSIFLKDFSHVFYLFPYQTLLDIILLRYLLNAIFFQKQLLSLSYLEQFLFVSF